MKNLFCFSISILLSVQLCSQSFRDLIQASDRLRMHGNDSAFIMIDHAIDMANTKNEEMYARVVKGDFFNRFDSLDAGIQYLKDLLKNYSEDLSSNYQAKSYYVLSSLYSRKNDFQQEIAMAQKGLALAEADGKSSSVYNGYFHLFQGFRNAGNQELSLQYGQRAFEFALASGKLFDIHQIAFYLFSYNRDKITSEPFSSYLFQYLEKTSPEVLPKDATHTGFQFLEQFKLTLEDWQDLYRKAVRENDPSTVRVGNKLGQILIENGKYNEAIRVLNSTRKLGYQNHSMLEVKMTLFELQKAYENTGNYRQAMETLTDFYQLRDSLQGIEVRKNADALNVQFQTEKKDRALAEQQVEILESKRQRNILIFSLIGILVIGGLILYMLRKKHQYQKKLSIKENQLKSQEIEQLKQRQKLIALDHMLMGEEKERSRIAKDLHDSLGSILTSAKNQMKRIQEEIAALQNESLFEHTEKLIQTASTEVRRISHDMMPNAIASLGIVAAIEDLASQAEHSGKLMVNTHFFDVDETEWTEQQKIGSYRVIQELTQNVIKHANASQLIIQLSQNSEWINLEVEDDGTGFDSTLDYHGIGLKNIDSRVKYLDGKLDIRSKPGGPTSFHIEIPLGP